MLERKMTHQEVRAILPHRYPFLLIDCVDEIVNGPNYPTNRVGRRVRCRKAVTVNEPYFVGHFPDRPIMPGVMQIECFAHRRAISPSVARGAAAATQARDRIGRARRGLSGELEVRVGKSEKTSGLRRTGR